MDIDYANTNRTIERKDKQSKKKNQTISIYNNVQYIYFIHELTKKTTASTRNRKDHEIEEKKKKKKALEKEENGK